MQFASAVGREVPVRLLYRLMRCAHGELDADLSALAASGLAQLLNEGSEPRLTFNHVLTQEVAYAGLLQQQRRYIHASIIEAFEYLYAERLDEHVEVLADHPSAPGCGSRRPSTYCARPQFIERSGHTQAVQLLKAALRLSALPIWTFAARSSWSSSFACCCAWLSTPSAIIAKGSTISTARKCSLKARGGNHCCRRSWSRGERDAPARTRRRRVRPLRNRTAQRQPLGRDDETRVIAAYMLSRSQFYNGQFRHR